MHDKNVSFLCIFKGGETCRCVGYIGLYPKDIFLLFLWGRRNKKVHLPKINKQAISQRGRRGTNFSFRCCRDTLAVACKLNNGIVAMGRDLIWFRVR